MPYNGCVSAPILATKLHVPPPRPKVDRRVRLLADPASGAKLLDSAWSSFARVDLLSSSEPSQDYIFTNGGAGSYMLRFNGDLSTIQSLQSQLEYLPFEQFSAPRTLILGSGAGNDVFIARAAVGDGGRVIGVDMTPEMIDKARENAARRGFGNVEFRLGDIETLPVEDASADVVVSNCVLNLVPDKRKAFAEIFRVLKPGGHFCISDIVLEGTLPAKLQSLAELYVGCVAGALSHEEYLGIIRETGFGAIEVKASHQLELPEEYMLEHIGAEGLAAYRASGAAVLSITVVGERPRD